MSEPDGADQDDETGAENSETTDPDSDEDEASDRSLADLAAETISDPAETADGEAPFEPGDVSVDDALVERVAETAPPTIAREIATLHLRVAALEGETAELQSEVENLESRLKRKQADFQNYKKRQEERLAEERERATEDLVTRLLEVRDNLQRAIDQDDDADIREGVESTLRLFDQELERENVERIEPTTGEKPDPTRHEVLMRVESDQPADTIERVHRPGYEMAGKVLRPAQVTVSKGDSSEIADGTDETGESDS